MEIPLQEDSPPTPSSRGFHGFEDNTIFPGRLVLMTEGQGDEEHVVKVCRTQKTGRPCEVWEKDTIITKGWEPLHLAEQHLTSFSRLKFL